MAKDGTNRGSARIGAGAKKKPLVDKIAEDNPGGRKLTRYGVFRHSRPVRSDNAGAEQDARSQHFSFYHSQTIVFTL